MSVLSRFLRRLSVAPVHEMSEQHQATQDLITYYLVRGLPISIVNDAGRAAAACGCNLAKLVIDRP